MGFLHWLLGKSGSGQPKAGIAISTRPATLNTKEATMFCYQCEQAAKGEGCTKVGVCGKQPEVSDLQDLAAYALRGLALMALKAAETGNRSTAAEEFLMATLFSTLTNVNFEEDFFVKAIKDTCRFRDELKAQVENTGKAMNFPAGPATFQPAADETGLLKQAEELKGAKLQHYPSDNADITSLMHIVLFGLKGVAAYADHAAILGQKDPELNLGVMKALAAGFDGQERDLGAWVNLAMEVGKLNLRAMELLDAGNTGTYGQPTPTKVPLGHKAGKAIVSPATTSRT